MLFVFQPANVLQAILCLINELDRDALEIVDDAIRNRLDMPLWLNYCNLCLLMESGLFNYVYVWSSKLRNN